MRTLKSKYEGPGRSGDETLNRKVGGLFLKLTVQDVDGRYDIEHFGSGDESVVVNVV